jgi:hypothetical protein
MALFGAPIAHEDRAQLACYAALHQRGELARYATEVVRAHGVGLSTRIGSTRATWWWARSATTCAWTTRWLR